MIATWVRVARATMCMRVRSHLMHRALLFWSEPEKVGWWGRQHEVKLPQASSLPIAAASVSDVEHFHMRVLSSLLALEEAVKLFLTFVMGQATNATSLPFNAH